MIFRPKSRDKDYRALNSGSSSNRRQRSTSSPSHAPKPHAPATTPSGSTSRSKKAIRDPNGTSNVQQPQSTSARNDSAPQDAIPQLQLSASSSDNQGRTVDSTTRSTSRSQPAPANDGVSLSQRPRRNAQRQNPRQLLDPIGDDSGNDSGDDYQADVQPRPRTRARASASASAPASTSSQRPVPSVVGPASPLTSMLQSVAPFSLAPRPIAPPQEGLSYHQRIRMYFTGLKQCHVYQLSPRPATSPKWQDVLEHRRAAPSLVEADALRPIDPLRLIKLETAAIRAAGRQASTLAQQAASEGRVHGLPFATAFEQAPLLGQDDVNVTIRDSSGRTILQRFSPTNLHAAYDVKKSWTDEGKAKLDALFARRNEAQDIHVGSWFDYDKEYGWTREHADLRPESDDVLRWIWRFFQAHVTTLACFLEPDFQENLQARKSDFIRQTKVLGDSQVQLFHPWWSMATVTTGFTQEKNEASDREPAILFGFEHPFMLYIAHKEGFFKTIVRPGQVVFFRSHLLHQTQPLVAASDSPHYAVSLAVRKNIVDPDLQPAGVRRRLRDPPQRGSEDKERRLSYKGIGHGRHRAVARGGGSSVMDEADDEDFGGGAGGARQRPANAQAPELAIVAGRKAWEQGLGGDGNKGEQ